MGAKYAGAGRSKTNGVDIVETKPGRKTTEFLTTWAAIVGVVSAALAGALPPKPAAYCVTVSVVAYAISRGLAKLGK